MLHDGLSQAVTYISVCYTALPTANTTVGRHKSNKTSPPTKTDNNKSDVRPYLNVTPHVAQVSQKPSPLLQPAAA